MSDTSIPIETAVLVHINLGGQAPDSVIHEFQELVQAAGVLEKSLVVLSRQKPDPKYFVGSGKVEELAQIVASLEAEVVIFNHELSRSQERNLENDLKCRVVSRTGLILDIFAQRARTFEGKLQVELAQLEHASTRLVRSATHLSRQGGGVGQRGPGETQLETDKRVIRDKIKVIRDRLFRVREQRQQSRKSRDRAQIPTVALVGYTNAGKSTLFNAVTKADVFVANQLFATLDPTIRRIEISGVGPVVLVDTVGFIRDLPHDLVDAFQATLLETTEADLLVHVIDSHDPDRDAKIKSVEAVLADIGASDVPMLFAMNKCDLNGSDPELNTDDEGQVSKVSLSAKSRLGLDLLSQAISMKLSRKNLVGELKLSMADAKLRSLLYKEGFVLEERDAGEEDWTLLICCPHIRWEQMCQKDPTIRQKLQQTLVD